MNEEQLAENMRFYGDMRFKQLTVWLAGMTVFAAGAVQFQSSYLAPSLSVREALAVAATIFTSVVWIMEVSSTMYFVANRQTAPHLWPRSSSKIGRVFSATNAILLLYVGTYGAWLWLGHQWGLSLFWLVLLFTLAILLGVVTIVRYLPIWKLEEGK